MPAISSPGPGSSFQSQRSNILGGEFGHIGVPSFGRGIDGDMNLTASYAPTSRRNGASGWGVATVNTGSLTKLSLNAATNGVLTVGHFVNAPAVPLGTTITSVVTGQSITGTAAGSSTGNVTVPDTSVLTVGQNCSSGRFGACYITSINSSTSITLSAVSVTGGSTNFVFYDVMVLSAAATQTYPTTGCNFATSATNTLQGRAVDSAQLALSAGFTGAQTSITPGSFGTHTDIKAGDTCVLVNQQGGANVGNWELVKIASVGSANPRSAATITLTAAPTRIYGATDNVDLSAGKVCLLRIPEYGAVTIGNGGVLTTDAWNGTAGGVLPVMAQSLTCTGTGKISVDGCGYRGISVAGSSGEGYTGLGTVAQFSNGSGGGGGAIVTTTGLAGAIGSMAPGPATGVSGGGGGGGGGSGGGAGGGGGYNGAGGAGSPGSRGGGGAAGGGAQPTGVGVNGGNGGSGVVATSGPSPIGTIPYGATGPGGNAGAVAVGGDAGVSIGAANLAKIYLGGAGGTCGTCPGSNGGSPGPGLAAPPTTPAPTAPVYVSGAGGAGGSGGSYSGVLKGGAGAGVALLFVRSATGLNVTANGLAGSPSSSGNGIVGSVGVVPANAPTVSNVNAGGNGGGGGGLGGSGSGASGTIYVFAQTLASIAVLNVSPVAGGAAGAGNSGGSTPSYPASVVNAAGAGVTGGTGGAGAAGRVKVMYVTLDGTYAAASADGAGIIPTIPSSPTPVGYKQTI